MATVQRVRKINLGTILIFSHRFDPVYKIKYAKSSYKEDDVHLKHALFPLSDRRNSIWYFFSEVPKSSREKETVYQKKSAIGKKPIRKGCICRLASPHSNQERATKKYFGTHFDFPRRDKQDGKRIDSKRPTPGGCCPKRCDSEMAMGKNKVKKAHF